MYMHVFSSLLGRITTESFLLRILIRFTIRPVLLSVSLPYNTLQLWSNTRYIQQGLIFFKEIFDKLTFRKGSLMWSELIVVFFILPTWVFYIEVLK